ncbi:uncharacterized protein LOC120837702 [Ixodes scapularis]|uniref:uncharacterized protein LOC120837702 n=1 Tax=Ixodes scapularis TaxID=6945 RepID=UPI001A9EA21A|nr:uncharacterized protein LOC120837702 [Ixodes scapularis]
MALAPSLPAFPPFDVSSSPATLGDWWRRWIDRFENLLTALKVKDAKQKKALLLHYIGEEGYDVYYEKTKQLLHDHFTPRVNKDYKIFNFRKTTQQDGETIGAFYTFLRAMARHCTVADTDAEIKSQTVLGMSSTKLRRFALQTDETLENILTQGRTYEITSRQLKEMETSATDQVNHLMRKEKPWKQRSAQTSKQQQTTTEGKCFNCAQQLRGSIGDRDIDFIVDRGASVNVIKHDTYSKLPGKPTLGGPVPKVYAYGSRTELPLMGKFSAELCYTDTKLRDITLVTRTPMAQKLRPIPFNIHELITKEIRRLEELDVIEKASGPTTWVSPIVVVPKPHALDTVRMRVDIRRANQAIDRERHASPTLDNLVTSLNGASVFSKLDLNDGYHQLVLHEDLRHITTFATHIGLYRYKGLNFGITAAAELFQNTVRQVLAGIPRVINISDDILVKPLCKPKKGKRIKEDAFRQHE